MKKIHFMDTSFRDGFQSCLGARVKMVDFFPVLEMAANSGFDNFEIGGGARFQALYFYCQEDAFEMMDKSRDIVGPNANLQTLSRGINVVGLHSYSRDIIDLHAKMFKKHGISTIRNFDALNDVRNLQYSGERITHHGLNHQIVVTLMSQPPGTDGQYAHSAKFYIDRLRQILDAEVPFTSLCFKDASGTCPPRTVYDTIKSARQLLGDSIPIEMHTHATAGIGEACYMAAIEAGADTIDLAMKPVSGGTSQPDILTMWHMLRGTPYTLDIDYEKIIKIEEFFDEQMRRYYIGPEARVVNPIIPLSPMPGGALTANTAMMRTNNILHLYPDVIKAMREVVAKGGYGSSVTPVSQFYFQQAFANVTQGAWKKITEGYGKMVLGYFGRTPEPPDAEVIQLASQQLRLQPTTENPLDLNDANPQIGVDATKKILQVADIEPTDENIFIAAACGERGIAYLKGHAPSGIEWKVDQEKKEARDLLAKYPDIAPHTDRTPAAYDVTVDGQVYHVQVQPSSGAIKSIKKTSDPRPPAREKQSQANGNAIKAPMPGTVLKIVADKGQSIEKGSVLLIIEAMKMEIEVKSDRSGKVEDIYVNIGDSITAEQPIMAIG